ncbi:hypothetical protein [Lentzea fradiae]|nr:hypothetical protein [Lentzea fradiae]
MALAGLALAGLAGTAVADVTPIHKTKEELQVMTEALSAHESTTFPLIFPGAERVTPGAWGGLAAGLFDGMQFVGNQIRFTYQGDRYTSVYLEIFAPGFRTDSPAQVCERTKCVSVEDDLLGGVVVVAEDEESRTQLVTSFRPNGEVVTAQAWRLGLGTELTAVATDRAYTFTG